jgi:5,10-methylene-tetrahydrofolate dehydrogenase/methenyl tetrahydrofolate cyclohydrolase
MERHEQLRNISRLVLHAKDDLDDAFKAYQAGKFKHMQALLTCAAGHIAELKKEAHEKLVGLEMTAIGRREDRVRTKHKKRMDNPKI